MTLLALVIAVLALAVSAATVRYVRQQTRIADDHLRAARDQAAVARAHAEVARAEAEAAHGEAEAARGEVAAIRDQAAAGRQQIEVARRQVAETERLLQRAEQEWHALVTPHFDVLVSIGEGDPDARRPRLRIHLVGPAGLDRLDTLTVSILDEPGDGRPDGGTSDGGYPDDGARGTAGDVVRGPYRLAPSADGTGPTGRTAAPAALERDDWHVLQLERTTAPPDYPGGEEAWQARYPAQAPVRLRLRCERSGYQPWEVLCETTAQQGPWRV